MFGPISEGIFILLLIAGKARFSLKHILLLEPAYRNKFPPIGLMKLATYHTQCRGDFVWFAKGRTPSEIPKAVKDSIRQAPHYRNRYGDDLEQYVEDAQLTIRERNWDRVYVTTLFTYEWQKTIELIEYAKELAGDPDKVFVGGIAATLMPKEIEEDTGIRPMRGLIADSAQLGYEPGICVDTLIPDYSILDHIEYRYPSANGYFLTSTRGCGNKCSFCAVQRLEPEYQDYLSILPRIEEIRLLYGEKKNLYLLDNNVLKSKAFPQIIDDIKQAGFARGATWLNPDTGKLNKRSVDFNQGLDAKFLTEDKARLLGEIALEPAHIAFDHIGEKERYLRAVHLMDKYDIRNVSSYLLYNTQRISSKGSKCDADNPRELYERMRIGFELNQEINVRRKAEGSLLFDCFAFPMRFIPLNAKSRDFVGDNWTKRLLAGVRTMLQPSRGGVFPTPDYFNYMYGSNYEEFHQILLLPHEYVRHKGKPAEKYIGEPPNRKWLLCIEEWKALYISLNQKEREVFEAVIADNSFQAATFLALDHPVMQKLYLHYFTGNALPEFLEEIRQTEQYETVRQYLLNGCPSMFWCCLELYSKQKTGDRRVSTLFQLLFPAKPYTSEKAV